MTFWQVVVACEAGQLSCALVARLKLWERAAKDVADEGLAVFGTTVHIYHVEAVHCRAHASLEKVVRGQVALDVPLVAVQADRVSLAHALAPWHVGVVLENSQEVFARAIFVLGRPHIRAIAS